MSRNMTCVGIVISAVTASLGLTVARGATNYVARNGQTPASPYLTWATAASNIQEAVNAAASGNTVLVGDGVYTLTNQIILAKPVTLISVNGAAAAVIDGNYPYATNRCLKYNQDINSTVDGFTIRNGYFLIPSGAGEGEYGGGGVSMFCDGILRNCTIVSNTCDNAAKVPNCGGGGVFMNRRSAIVSNCVIRGNRFIGTGRGGGGIYMFAVGNARMVDCTLEENDAPATSGGGAHLWGGIVSNCLFAGNTAKAGGGFFQSGAYVPQRNCTFVGNLAGEGGGATIAGGWFIDCVFSNNVATNTYGGGVAFGYGGSASNCLFYGNICAGEGGGLTTLRTENNICRIHNCLLIANQAAKGGGGAKSIYEGQYRNCLFLNNTNTSATGGGGGLYAAFMSGHPVTSPTVGGGYADNLTLAGNQSGGLGGGLRVEGIASNLFHNTVIYGNLSTGDAYEDVRADGTTSNAFFFCSTSIPLAPNQGNILGDPRYLDLVGGDVRLKGGSPCVNAGVNQSWMAAALDLAGKPRLDRASGRVDMGAYEHVPSGSCVLVR